MERFYQIKDFLSLRRHYDCSRHHYEISQYKQNEDTPLVAKKKPSKMKMSYLPLLVSSPPSLAPLVFLAYLFAGVTSSIYWLLPHHCLLWNNGSDVSTIQGWLKGERSGNMEHERVHPPLLRRCVQGHAYSLLLLCM